MSNKEEKVEDKENEEEEEEEVVNPDEMSPDQKLFYFAKRGDIDGIKTLAQSVDINAIDEIGFQQNPYISKNTALHYAVMSGSLECVKVLYNLEAKLDIENKLKSTPLHIAASLGHGEIVKFLIEMKANICAKNIVSNTPLHCAVYAGHVNTTKIILSNLDEPRNSLLEPNGVGMAAAKYTAHDEMKNLLRTYFPKKINKNKNENNGNNIQEEEQNEQTPEYKQTNDDTNK
eukprot:252095_1